MDMGGVVRGALFAAAAAIAACLAGPVGAATAAPVSYGFDGGSAQGWNVANNFDQPQVLANVNPTGGNPGGYLVYNDFAGDATALVSFFSPVLPAGSFAANYGGTISFDFRIQGGLPTRTASIHLSSPQGNIFRTVAVSSTNDFQRLSAPFSAAGWLYCPPPNGGCAASAEAEMLAALSAATQVELEVDVRSGINETYSIDNFSLTDPPPVVQAGVTPTPTPVSRKRCKKKKGSKGAEAAKKNRKKCKRNKKRN